MISTKDMISIAWQMIYMITMKITCGTGGSFLSVGKSYICKKTNDGFYCGLFDRVLLATDH